MTAAVTDSVVYSVRLPLDDDWAWTVLKDLFPEMRVEYWYDSRGKLLRQTVKHMYVGMTAVGDVYKLRHIIVNQDGTRSAAGHHQVRFCRDFEDATDPSVSLYICRRRPRLRLADAAALVVARHRPRWEWNTCRVPGPCRDLIAGHEFRGRDASHRPLVLYWPEDRDMIIREYSLR